MSSLPDFASMTDEEIDQYIGQQREAVTLLYKHRDPQKRLPRTVKDPEELAKQVLRVLAKVAGRNNRQAEQAIQRRADSAEAYSAGVAGYLADRQLENLPEDLYSELSEIWTYHNTPQRDRPE